MSDRQIPDDEIVYRRIPPGIDFFAEPDRVSTNNFKLDKNRGDQGLSVYCHSVVSPDQILKKSDAVSGSRIAAAKVGDIRTLHGGDGKHLLLDVIVVDDDADPGHAEIRGPEAGKLSRSAGKALRDLFKLV